MSFSWAASFARSSLFAALPLRLGANIEACVEGDTVWLRGTGDNETIGALLRRIPDVVRYTVAIDEQLTIVGRRIPCGSLPRGAWAPLTEFMRLRPQATLPGSMTGRVPLNIVRSEEEEPPGAMTVTLEQWADYAVAAPQVRLRGLRFAVNAKGQAVVVGHPLPPIPGNYYVEHSGLLLPCGYAWQPRVEAEIVRRILKLSADDIALFSEDGSYQIIAAEFFVRASRSAARRTLAKFEAAGEAS